MGISGAIPLLLRRLALVPLLVFAVLVFTYVITQIAPAIPSTSSPDNARSIPNRQSKFVKNSASTATSSNDSATTLSDW